MRYPKFMFFLVYILCLHQSVFSQVPNATKVSIEGVTVEFSNIRIVSATKMNQDTNGSTTEAPALLDKNKLYPPGTRFFIAFDYKHDLSSNSDPKSIERLMVGAEIEKGKSKGFQGYGPCGLKGPNGNGAVWLSDVAADESKLVEVETRLKVYGVRNDKSLISSVPTQEPFRFTARMDRLAMITETQFDALKGMYRRLQELENRITELESRNRK